jgi:hypothetical protein
MLYGVTALGLWATREALGSRSGWLTAGYFELDDTSERYYVQGLAWSLVAVAEAPQRKRALQRELRERLLAFQTDEGGFSWNADYPAPDLQSTAHAVRALSLTERRAELAAFRGARWIARQQLDNGGFPYTTAQEGPLLDGEILLALYLLGTSHGSSDVPGTDAIAARRSAVKIAIFPSARRARAPLVREALVSATAKKSLCNAKKSRAFVSARDFPVQRRRLDSRVRLSLLHAGNEPET